MASDLLQWQDYLEIALLIVACLLGLVGNLMVLKVSLRIRSFSRQISLLFWGILCADVLVCATRIPATVYLIFSKPQPDHNLLAANVDHLSVTTSSSLAALSRDLSHGANVSMRNNGSTKANVTWKPAHKAAALEVMDGGEDLELGNETDQYVDIACELWAVSSALLMTVVWLHLVVGAHRLAIIYSFFEHRKRFNQTVTSSVVLGTWLLSFAVIYAPLRAAGIPMQRAGRGACRASDVTSDNLLLARSVVTAFLCVLPLLVTTGCYVTIAGRVWLARGVRTEAASEYNRVILVTVIRLLSLLVTYLPVCLVLIIQVRRERVPDAAHRYVGHLLWLQSVVSPFVTLQDNDFRERLMVPKHAAGINGNGQEVLPAEAISDTGNFGGQERKEHQARNLEQMKLEHRRQLQRGISFITSAEMRAISIANDGLQG